MHAGALHSHHHLQIARRRPLARTPLFSRSPQPITRTSITLDLDEAERRSSIQDRAAGIEDDVASVLGDQYAGIWYDEAEAGQLKVGVTPSAGKFADGMRQLAERYGVVADMDLVTVRFTHAELEQKQNDVRKRIADIVDAGRARTSYNTKLNMVLVTALAKLLPS